ncbi:MAG: hypothetical protein PVJ49_14515, partial [Acidobacteriota bacterium]
MPRARQSGGFVTLLILTFIVVPPLLGRPGAEPDPVDTRLLAEPAISATHIAFAYAGDLWSARIDGSDARRLTTHPGEESRPR